MGLFDLDPGQMQGLGAGLGAYGEARGKSLLANQYLKMQKEKQLMAAQSYEEEKAFRDKKWEDQKEIARMDDQMRKSAQLETEKKQQAILPYLKRYIEDKEGMKEGELPQGGPFDWYMKQYENLKKYERRGKTVIGGASTSYTEEDWFDDMRMSKDKETGTYPPYLLQRGKQLQESGYLKDVDLNKYKATAEGQEEVQNVPLVGIKSSVFVNKRITQLIESPDIQKWYAENRDKYKIAETWGLTQEAMKWDVPWQNIYPHLENWYKKHGKGAKKGSATGGNKVDEALRLVQ